MDRIKLFALISGTACVLYGYWLLAVPEHLPYERVIVLAKAGMVSVLAGGVLLLVGILRRS